MKHVFALSTLLAALGLFFIGYAQINRDSSPTTELTFEPINIVNDRGEARDGPAIYMLDVRMSNGDTCYFMSTASTITQLESLNQITPVGCANSSN